MGIVALGGWVLGFGLLAFLFWFARDLADEAPIFRFFSYFIGICIAFAVLTFVDAHVYSIPNPFRGQMATELPKRPPAIRHQSLPKLEAEEVSPDLHDVEAEHRAHQQRFEDGKRP